jgi:uncharacterized protein
MRIAVIGSGVAGLAAAYALKDSAEVVIYERETRLGGHARTVSIDYDGRTIDVDTGFIVFNSRNYPNLVGLFETLGVESLETDMSFAFAGGGLEWSSNFSGGVFAQKRNLASPRFMRMLADIGRFNRTAPADIGDGKLENLTLGDYLRQRGFGPDFRDRYLLPMSAAIWSTSGSGVAEAPAESVISFFANHNLLQMVQPLWRTVAGGSRTYVDRLRCILGGRVRAGLAVTRVRRVDGGIEVTDEHGAAGSFDQVILACHSDQTLKLLADADAEERAILGAIRFGPNLAYLHRDPRLMPRRRAAWGSWNALFAEDGAGSVTYWMNNLQQIDVRKPLFVSLNPLETPDPALTFEVFGCEHPQFDATALAAQRRIGRIQGRGGVWHAGAWLGHGFHEDGLTAGLRVGLALGGQVPWPFVDHRIPGGPLPAPMAAASASVRRAAA